GRRACIGRVAACAGAWCLRVSPIEGERLAVIEQMIRDLREDIDAMKTEQVRTRDRLHKLEGTTAGLVQEARTRSVLQEESSRSVMVRLQVLTVVVAVAALGEPLLYHLGPH